MTWEFSLTFAPDNGMPRFLQIGQAVITDISDGVLRPGDALPGSRTLAKQLGVHRNTVVAAYETLAAEGWVTTRRGGRTYVSDALPESGQRSPKEMQQSVRLASCMGYSLPAAAPLYGWQTLPPFLDAMTHVHPPDTLAISCATPDLRLFPGTLLARAYRRVLQHPSRHVLGYGSARGHPRLLRALIAMLAARRGLVAEPENVVITRGSQMALFLAARALCAPGEVIAVEAMGYPAAWEAFHLAGATLVPVAVDAHGMVVEHLAALLARQRVRAIYVTPHFQCPTMAVLSPSRRLALLQLARDHNIAIIEDDYHHDFHYAAPPVRPLMAADMGGTVIYVGSLSKIMAPGLRLGFAAAPQPLIARMAALRSACDVQGDMTLECAIAELSEDGDIARHIRFMSNVYHARRNALVGALHAQLADVVRFEVPPGGVNLWVRVRDGVDVEAWAEAGLRHKVAFVPGRRFAFDGQARPYIRLCYGALGEDELVQAVGRMRAAFASMT